MNPLVSVIIPTFNRAHLIGETLDSLLNQTYANWECIIVDDGSSDNTDELIEEYIVKDSRFKYYHRPETYKNGGNGARNYGFEISRGEYVIWFDSDDVMTNNHIEVKISKIVEMQCDYVIARTEYFNCKKTVGNNNYRFEQYALTPYNYVTQAINWLTYDICLKRSIAEKIRFNENLKSGQEYNFFSKLVFISTDYYFIDKVVTLRRSHDDSIRSNLDDYMKYKRSAFLAKWYTYVDLHSIADAKSKKAFLNKCLLYIYETKANLAPNKLQFFRAIQKEYKWKVLFFLLLMLSLKLFGKGYFFYKKMVS